MQSKLRALQKEQAIIEKTIRSSTEKKIRADDALRESLSRMNDCDLKVESCKSDVQSVVSSRAALEKKLQSMQVELAKLENRHEQANRE